MRILGYGDGITLAGVLIVVFGIKIVDLSGDLEESITNMSTKQLIRLQR